MRADSKKNMALIKWTGNPSTARIVSTFTRTFATTEEHKMQGFGKQTYGIHPETTYITLLENTGKKSNRILIICTAYSGKRH